MTQIIDFAKLEKELTKAYESRVEEIKIVYSNYKTLGYVQRSENARFYVVACIKGGARLIRIVPGSKAKTKADLIVGRDDFEDGYIIRVTKGLSIPLDKFDIFTEDNIVNGLVSLMVQATQAGLTMPLYDEANVVRNESKVGNVAAVGHNWKRLRTRCHACNKVLATKKIIIFWRNMLFHDILCAKGYVKSTFPEQYLKFDEEYQYIVPEDLGLDRELALERLTSGQIKYRNPDKRIIPEGVDKYEEEEIDEDDYL